MPKEKSENLDSPIFSDFLYTILWQSSLSERRGLKGKYIKALASERAAKNFIKTATFEEKQYLLSHFGIKFFWVFCKEQSATFKTLLDILKLYEAKKEIKSMEELAATEIFVSGDKQFNHLLGLMSSSIHRPNFHLNLEFKRLGYSIKKWKKRLNSAKDLEIRDVMEENNSVVRTVLNSTMQINYVPGLTGLTIEAMQVLLFLYLNKHTFVSRDVLQEYFVGNIKPTKMNYSLKGLVKNMYVTEHIDKSEYRVMISGHGVKAVCGFIDSIIKLNSF